MANMSPSTEAKSVYALVGADPFLQLEALRDILTLLGNEAQRADFEGDRAELVNVLDELRCFSMFSKSKLVVIRDADDFVADHREKLEDFLNDVADGKETLTGTLILRLSSLPSNQRIYKIIAKLGEVRKCDPPPLKEIPTWITARAKSHHRAMIDSAAAKQLADLIGDDLGRLDSELGKLAIQADAAAITPAHVTASVSFQREQEIWEITTLLGRGKPQQAVTRWRDLVRTDNSAQFRLITWLLIWLENSRLCIQSRETGDPPYAVLQKICKVWDPAAFKEYHTTALRLGKAGVASRLDRLTDMDRRLKSGLGDPADSLERFLATALDEA